MLHLGVMLSWGVSLPQWERVTCEGKIEQKIQNVPTSHVISSPQPCCHPMAPPCSPLKPPSSGWGCPLRWQLFLVMLQGGEARAGVSPGCCGRRPEGGSWVPELPHAGLADMWDVEQRVHTYGFGMFIWNFHFMVMPP